MIFHSKPVFKPSQEDSHDATQAHLGMAGGSPEYHMDILGNRLGGSSCAVALAWLGQVTEKTWCKVERATKAIGSRQGRDSRAYLAHGIATRIPVSHA